MNIKVNNKTYELKDNCNLVDVLETARITNKFGIAIAVNNVVVSKKEWEKYIVKDKDNILIINAIFGG
ncbi:MAG: sulfur carrier protein ThiS [Bacteroidales bacterium]|jgi:sulfur carrier protein|nr:sulfur carrier protein ThiS [Bacteroidales bacterium]